MKDALGDRMKFYESREAGRRFLPRLPVCVRIDGKNFSRFTRDLGRPYDPRLSALMVDVTRFLVEETQARIGYAQSDEISLVLWQPDPKSPAHLDGRVQKLCSILASQATARFAARIPELLPEKAGTLALFDCRAWEVPDREEAANTLLWRELDATKNSLSMVARHYYSHEQLHGKSSAELHQLLHDAGVNWNDYPAFFKRGTFVQRRTVRRSFEPDERQALPPLHAARRDPDLVIERAVVEPIAMPPFGRVTNRVEVIFEGAEPRVA